jgi:hypothetical protein
MASTRYSDNIEIKIVKIVSQPIEVQKPNRDSSSSDASSFPPESCKRKENNDCKNLPLHPYKRNRDKLGSKPTCSNTEFNRFQRKYH